MSERNDDCVIRAARQAIVAYKALPESAQDMPAFLTSFLNAYQAIVKEEAARSRILTDGRLYNMIKRTDGKERADYLAEQFKWDLSRVDDCGVFAETGQHFRSDGDT